MHPASRPSDHRRRRRRARLALLALLFLGICGLASRYRLVWVVGNSMLPTFRSGDLLLVDRWAYRRREPARGEVVVASHHGEWVIKRVVGLPGETVEVHEGRVEIDGTPLESGPTSETGHLNIASARLLSHRFAILGDNRAIDPASFIHAVVGPEQLLGRVVLPAGR
ncbi:MAG: signal peptidase I [Verrucomicrobiales bacterium]|nr:signal peptidase I [Verrucomicrobiales bacterium]